MGLSDPEALLFRILSERGRWIAFLRSRGAAEADVEDLLQTAFLKAFEKGATVRSKADGFAWFYQILRNTLINQFRKRESEQRRIDELHVEIQTNNSDFSMPEVAAARLCQCMHRRLHELNGRYAELIRKVDLEGASPTLIAAEADKSLGSINVTLHRARKALRKELEEFCKSCATDGACLDCRCSEEDLEELV